MKAGGTVWERCREEWVEVEHGKCRAISCDSEKPNGEVMVFSHGLLMCAEIFGEMMEHFTKSGYKCIAYDHLAQGKSTRPEAFQSVSTEVCYKDAVRVIEHFTGGKPVHFVGHSMGGFVAVRLAARRPDLARSIALVNSTTLPEPLSKRHQYHRLNSVMQWAPKRLFEGTLLSILLSPSSRRTAVDTKVRELLRSLHPASSRIAANGVIDRPGCSEEARACRVPALVVHGAEDAAIPVERAETAAEELRCGLEQVEHAGHTLPLEAPDALSRLFEQRLLNSLRAA